MSRKGNCWDDACVESFFSTLKQEQVYERAVFRTREEAHDALFEYLELFYNARRLHSALGYMSSAEYERQAATAAMRQAA